MRLKFAGGPPVFLFPVESPPKRGANPHRETSYLLALDSMAHVQASGVMVQE